MSLESKNKIVLFGIVIGFFLSKDKKNPHVISPYMHVGSRIFLYYFYVINKQLIFVNYH